MTWVMLMPLVPPTNVFGWSNKCLGFEKGQQERVQGSGQRTLESKRNAARKLLARTEMDDQTIADIEEMPVE